MNLWKLPVQAEFDGVVHHIHADFRDVLDVIAHLEDPSRPEWLRWKVALSLFYEEDIPPESESQAMEWMADFIALGEDEQRPAPRLLDWNQDAAIVVADINKTAGCEIRALPFLHWWTFIGYFNAIEEGQLSTIVTIRDKLRSGKKLESWEREYYRKNKKRVDLKRQYSPEEEEERARLKQILDGKG